LLKGEGLGPTKSLEPTMMAYAHVEKVTMGREKTKLVDMVQIEKRS
jgi:hypothetical protein